MARNGHTALMSAALQGYVEIAKLLLQGPSDKDLARTDGTTALMFASLHGNVEVARLLVEAGASKDLVDTGLLLRSFIQVTISWICIYIYISLSLSALIMGIELFEVSSLTSAQDKHGHTALMNSCLRGHFEVVKMLLEAGADKSIMDNKGAMAIFSVAVKESKIKTTIVKGKIVNNRLSGFWYFS